jgi:hypothetical protein
VAGGAIVGALKYLVEVDSARAEAEIDKFMAEAQAKVEAAGGDATFRLLADSAQLDKDIAEAQAKVERIEAKKATVEIDGDTSDLVASLAAARTELNALEGRRHEIKLETRGAVQALAELKAVKSLQDSITNDTERGTKSQLAQNLAVAKLRESYNKAAGEAQKLARATRPGETGGLEGQRLALSRVRSEMSLMEHEGRRLGANLHNITQDVEGQQPLWRKWADSISKAHINMGPFSTTLKGAAVGAATLAPLLVSLVGSASALAGAVGVGLVGAFGVAAGAMAGLGLTALGAGIALHQPIHQLGVAHKAATAYSDAVQKYGKDSSQAKDKQAQMNQALKGLPPGAQAAVRSLGQMRGEFMKLGGNAIRGDFFNSFAQGIKTAKALLPAFAQGSKTAFHAASQGFNDWMKGLRGGEAQHILSNLMGNFTKDIGPAMAGLGSLGTAFGRFISIASNSGPGIANTFQDWAQGIQDSTAAGTGFAAKVNDMVDKAKSLGRFLTGTGRLAGAFFGAGADSGQQLLDSMTKAENRWTSWMRSVEGRRSLQNFFKESVANTTALAHALAPLGRVFLGFSRAFTPVTTGVLNFVSALGDIVGFASKLAPLRILFQGLGVAIGTAFVANRIQSWIGAIGNAMRFLGILPAAVTSETAAVDANTAALEANTAAHAENAAASVASGEAAVGSGAAMAAGTAEVEASATAAGASAAGLGLGLAAAFALPVGAAIALTVLLGKTDDVIGTYHDRLRASASAAQDTASATQALSAALGQANKLADKGKQRTEGYRSAVVTARAAEAQRTISIQKQQQAQANLRNSLNDLSKAQRIVNTTGQSNTAVLRGGATAVTLARNTVQALSGAYDQFHLAQINVARTTQGLSPILQSQARLFGIVRAQIGKGLTAKIGVSGTAGQSAQIARLASQLQSFASKKAVAKILVSDEGAAAKIRQLQALLDKTDRPHHTKVTASTNKGEVDSYLAAAAKADRTHTTNIRANVGPALSAVAQMQAAVDALHGKTITNYVNNVVRGGAEGPNHFRGGVVPGFAAGGAVDWMTQMAWKKAAGAKGLNPLGGARVNQPRYVVGEEPGRTEFIITDNPAYRKSNLGFLMEAARALGAAVAIPGYKKGKGADKKALKNAKKGINAAQSTDPVTQWESLQADQQYWADEYDLDRRSHDSGVGGGGTVGGFAIGDLLGDLGFTVQGYGIVETGGGEVGAYRAMQKLLPTLQGLSKAKLPDYSPGSDLKGKKLKKANAVAKRISDYNSAVDEAKSDYQSTSSRDIDHSIPQPQDPHIWAQNTVFEITAAGA